MGRTERKFADRMGKKLETIRTAEKQDALNMTSGAYKRMVVESSAGEFSSLRREKAPWNDQITTAHMYFSTPEPHLPGDHEYDTGLRKYVEQPDRATSFARDVVIGDNQRTSFWKPRQSGAATGNTERLAKSQALLCPPGVRRLREEAARSGGNKPVVSFSGGRR